MWAQVTNISQMKCDRVEILWNKKPVHHFYLHKRLPTLEPQLKPQGLLQPGYSVPAVISILLTL